jgi:hypothetical protein
MGRFVSLTHDLTEAEGRGAHPICVLKKLVEKGIDPRKATKEQRSSAALECIKEGKYHGIYKLVRKFAT